MPKIEDFEPGGLSEYSQNIEPGNKRNALVSGISSGLDDLQGLFYSGAAAAADAVGAKDAKKWLNEQADRNEYESAINGRSDLEKIENQSLGSALPYTVYQVGKQVPQLIGAIAAGAVVPEAVVPAALARGAAMLPRAVGGGGMAARLAAAGTEAGAQFGAKRAALAAGEKFGEQLVGGAAFNYGQSVGSLYQAAREGGDDNAGVKSLVGGVPYAIAETLPEAMLAGRFKNGSGFQGNLLSRMGKSAGLQAASGATSEGLQNEMEIAYNGSMSDEEKGSARLNSIVAGGLVEGIFGSVGGISRGGARRQPNSLLGDTNQDQLRQAINVHDDSGLSTQQIINQTVGVTNQEQIDAAHKNRQSDLDAAFNEKTGQFVVDPVTGHERELTAGDLAAIQSGTGQAQTQAVIDQAAQVNQQQAAAANQQAQQVANEQAQQQQEQRADTLKQFGIIKNTNDQNGSFFGVPIFGQPRLSAIADALAPVLKQAPTHKMAILDAIVKAGQATGVPLIKFKFNADKVQDSVKKAFEAVDKVERELQIDHVQSIEEAATILNSLSETVKGKQLDQINAIHEALTGKDTSGYLASQSGDKNGQQNKLPVQQQVRSDERQSSGGTGSVQSGQLQSLITGSQSGGQNSQQNATSGTPSTQVVGSTANPNASVASVSQEGQVNEQANATSGSTVGNEQGQGQAVGNGTSSVGQTDTGSPQALFSRVTGGQDLSKLTQPLQQAWHTAVSKGQISKELAQELLNQNAEEAHSPLAKALELIYTRGKNKENYRNLVEYLLGLDAKERPTTEWLAATFGFFKTDKTGKTILDKDGKPALDLKSVSNVLGELNNPDRTSNGKRSFNERLLAALEQVKKDMGITDMSQFRSLLIKGSEDRKAAESASVVAKDEIGQEFANSEVEVSTRGGEDEDKKIDNGINVTSRVTGESVSEQNNAGEGIAGAYERLSKEIDSVENAISEAENEGDYDKVAELQTKRDALESRLMSLAEKADKEIKKSAAQNYSRETEEEDNAVQEQSTDAGNVRKSTGSSKKVGKGNAQSESSTKQSEAKAEVKSEGTDETKSENALVPQEVKEQQLWDAHAEKYGLPTYDRLPAAIKADWMLAVKAGKTNLAAVNNIVEENRKALSELEDNSNTIDGTNLITEVAEPAQRQLLTDQTNKLTEAQQTRLEEHYGEKRDSEEFFQKLREDVINYVTKGAEAVNAKIRDIIRSIANGVMAMAVVFNPHFISNPQFVEVPKFSVKTVEVTAQVPAEIADKMSPAAKRVWEVVWPSIKADLKAKNKLFIITDKPTAMTFVFSPEGKVLFQTKTLQSKSLGDYYKGNNDVVANRITPAGKYTIYESSGTKSSHGYDYDTVYGVSNANKDYFLTLLHSVWLHEKDAPQRAAALKKAGAEDSRYSFGCINVDTQTFGNILKEHREQMNGATLFVVPDAQENVNDFINGKAVASTDMDREKVDPVVKKVVTSLGTTEAKITAPIYGREEKTTRSKKGSQDENIASKEQNDFLDGLNYDIDFKNQGTLGVEVSREELVAKFPAIARGIDALKEIGTLALDKIDKFIIMKNSGSDASIITTFRDGKQETIIGFDEAALRTMTEGETAFTAIHELGHIMDMAAHGGIYSAHPDMRFQVQGKTVIPVGDVAVEIYDAIQSDETLKELFAYPLDAKYSKNMDSAELQQEMFAQLWAMMPNQKLNALLQSVAPQTHQFMTEVFEHAKAQEEVRSGFPFGAGSRVEVNKAAFEDRYKGSKATSAQGLSRGTPEEVVIRNKKTLHDLTDQAKNNIRALPKWAQGPAYAVQTSLFNAKEFGLGWLLSIDVVDKAKKIIPAAKDFYDAHIERNRIKEELNNILEKIMISADKLNSREKKGVNSLIADMTLQEKWAYDPKITGAVVDPELKARFDAMSPSAQAVVKRVFEHARETLDKKKTAIRERIARLYDDRIAEATGDEEKAQLEKEKQALLSRFSTIMNISSVAPYAPLRRFGEFVIVAKSKAYVDAEKNGDSKEIRKLESDGKHYTVEFASTYGEALQIRDDLNTTGNFKGGEIQDPFKKSEARDHIFRGNDLYQGFEKLKRVIATRKSSAFENNDEEFGVIKQLETMVDELYLMSLAEHSARKSELERKKIPGYNPDMLRSFFTQGAADSHFIANLQMNDQIFDTIVEMQRQAKGQRAEANPYINELMMREAKALELRPNSMMDAINRMTGNWFLSFSPSFYLQQATQSYMLSLPWLAARHGFFKSLRMMNTAYKEILPLIKGTSVQEHLDFDKAPADVQEMLKDLIGRGYINIGTDAELGGYRSDTGNKAGDALNAVANKTRGILNRIEAINRSTAAITAYRLEMKRSGDKVKATEEAAKVVQDTHGLYDGFNTPRWFGHNAVTRSATQFRRFQIIQLTTLAKMFKDMFAGATPMEKAIARKHFMYLTVNSMALGGAKGLPYYGLLSLAYTLSKAAFGDGDDPEDLEAYLRKHGGLFVARGIPAELGLDVSGKLGQGNTMSILPFTDVDLTTRSGYEKAFTALSGPFFGGILPNMVDGIGQVAGGHYYKGLEMMMPNGINSAMKAVRFANEGVTMRNGDVVMSPEEVGFAAIVGQAVGLPTTSITERQYLQSELKKYDDFYSNRAKEIKAQYAQAYRDNDTATMSDARDAWSTLQASRVENGYKRQPVSDLLKAPAAQTKREKGITAGVETTKNNRGFVRQKIGD